MLRKTFLLLRCLEIDVCASMGPELICSGKPFVSAGINSVYPASMGPELICSGKLDV